jgi:hypothetical protein
MEASRGRGALVPLASDPLESFINAANQSRSSPLLVQATVQLLDANGSPTDFITGGVLKQVLERAYRRVFGRIHAAHQQRFAAITDWRFSAHSIHAIAAAIVDPFIDVCATSDARLFHLCCQVLVQTQYSLPRDLWWTPLAMARLQEANPDPIGRQVNPGIVIAGINFACYYYCCRFMVRTELPFTEDDPVRPLNGYRRNLRRLAKGFLTMLLDEADDTGCP